MALQFKHEEVVQEPLSIPYKFQFNHGVNQSGLTMNKAMTNHLMAPACQESGCSQRENSPRFHSVVLLDAFCLILNNTISAADVVRAVGVQQDRVIAAGLEQISIAKASLFNRNGGVA
jgi:hypothetical protein